MATCAQRIAVALQRHGVEIIFGQSLPSALILAAEDIGIRQVVYRTENAGGAMADGYARTSGRIGVVAAQNGPAATLLVPPLAEALKASIPILALVQEVNRGDVDRNAFQEFDHLGLFAPCAKFVRRVSDAKRIDDYVDMAVVAATSGRPGPAVLLFPMDLLNEMVEGEPSRVASHGRWPLDPTVADPARIAQAAKLLAEAKAPLVIAGGGVHASGAADALANLQGAAHLPVAYTMMGKGAVSDGHPLTVGLIGNAMGARSLGEQTRPVIDEADVVLLVGTRTNQNGTDSWTIFKDRKKIIHIDIDGLEIGRNFEPAVRLCGDARLTLEALHAEMNKLDLSARAKARDGIAKGVATAKTARAKRVETVLRPQGPLLRPEQIMAQLQPYLRDTDIVVADASYASVWINSYLESLRAGQRFLAPRGIAGLGWGYPMALGAKLASPASRVICIAGDGGFGHCWSELETAARMHIPVTLVVLNNAVLGFQKDAELVRFGRYSSACTFAPVDHAMVARACGVEGRRITGLADLRTALDDALSGSQSMLLDVLCDPDAYPPLTMFDGKFPDREPLDA